MGLPHQLHVEWVPSHPITDAPPSAAFTVCDECDRDMPANPIVLETAGHNICSACLESYLP